MSKKQKDQKFDTAVKPYYYPKEHCFIVYSASTKLSKQASFEVLSTQQVKKKFGFNLLCDDFNKSARQAEKYMMENNLGRVPQKFFDDMPEYTIEGGDTNKFFILHNTSAKSGFGISTYSPLPKFHVLAEYVGERKDYYKFSDNTYALLSGDGTKIDSKDYGNAARFFNHCPDEHDNPNVLTANLILLMWKSSDKLTKGFFVTTREIKAFEPLCWDYGARYNFGQEVELLDAKTYQPLPNNIDYTPPSEDLLNFLGENGNIHI